MIYKNQKSVIEPQTHKEHKEREKEELIISRIKENCYITSTGYLTLYLFEKQTLGY
jgi:hypothetical protein